MRPLRLLSAALASGAMLVAATPASGQTVAQVKADPPVVKFAGIDGGMAVYDVVVRASSDQPKDRWHVRLTFCDDNSRCEQVASVTDVSGDDPRTTQTWPDAPRGVPVLQVRLRPEQKGTLKARWEIYTMHEYAWEGAKSYDAPPVPIGPAPGADAGGKDGAGGGSSDGAGERPWIRIARHGTRGRLRVRVACSRACRGSARIRVSRRAAMRARLDGRTIARVHVRLRRAGIRVVWLRVGRRAALRLGAKVRARASGEVVQTGGATGRDRHAAVVRLR